MVPLVVLIVLDGWGVAPPSPGNAIEIANTPNMDKYWAAFPHATLAASGEAVGLPKGEVGNTETGHLNLGAGRIVYQDLLRINQAIADGSFFKNKAFLGALDHANKHNSNLHLLGLVGSGGVHSNMEHLFALLRFCKEQKFERVFLHLFTDGRDSPPTSAENYLSQVQEIIKREGVGQIASVTGRYWSMDRDRRWERTERAYKALTQGVGLFVESAQEAIEASYKQNITDEFINPSLVCRSGKPIALVTENDSVIFFNFRIDRPRQLTRAFVFEDFENENKQAFDFDPYKVRYEKSHLSANSKQSSLFNRGKKIKNLYFVTMTKYENPTAKYVDTAFPPVFINYPLGAVIANRGFAQLRMSESEKERFVTFYFNGQQETIFPQENRIILPSSREMTYDKIPQMSANEITETFLQSIGDQNLPRYSFVLINFANADMVGHTGNLEAVKKACETVDFCLGKIINKVDQLSGVVVIVGDHGNAEQMLSPAGQINTEHSANPVPFIVVGKIFLGQSMILPSGILADVAPTILKLLGIDVPSEMTGRPLL